MNRIPVSVVIPTYNRAHLLGRAIASVVNQSTRPDELIVVDDGSTDSTPLLLQELKGSTPFEMSVVSQPNKGPAAARNRGIGAARNDTIAFLDSDDHWTKQKLEKQYRTMTGNANYVISHTRERWLRRGEHLNQKKKHIPRHGLIFDHCLQLCAVGMSTVMVKKQLFTELGSFDETFPCCEDYDLWLRVSCKYPFLLIDHPLTVKEGGRQDQVSFQYRLGMDELRIRSIIKLLDSKTLGKCQSQLAVRELVRKIAIFAGGCIKHGRVELGNRYLALVPKYEQMVAEKQSL